jgi:cell division protein FtsL
MPALRQHAISKVSILVIVALVLTQILISNQLADAGANLSQLQDQIQNTTQQNHHLQQTITSKISLTTITQQAPNLGYDQTPKLVTISPPASLALETNTLN